MKFEPTKHLSEAMLQAEFYQACKDEGLKCYLEYRSQLNGGRRCRFDAVIVEGDEVIAIVEIKAYRGYISWWKQQWLNSKQATKYRQYGVPVFIVARRDDILQTIQKIVNGEGG